MEVGLLLKALRGLFKVYYFPLPIPFLLFILTHLFYLRHGHIKRLSLDIGRGWKHLLSSGMMGYRIRELWAPVISAEAALSKKPAIVLVPPEMESNKNICCLLVIYLLRCN
ncbi:hypothetical protein CEXT_33991 [Caerostris extrusa]|uniref:Uncharacterized protein n=1 Tax=Caerostris extrusa TaxID=172846 RepID=A0AAV4XPW8_CAEEX|nr:hypothetical protein CEXT_33991 [Caerostris extrusa]